MVIFNNLRHGVRKFMVESHVQFNSILNDVYFRQLYIAFKTLCVCCVNYYYDLYAPLCIRCVTSMSSLYYCCCCRYNVIEFRIDRRNVQTCFCASPNSVFPDTNKPCSSLVDYFTGCKQSFSKLICL